MKMRSCLNLITMLLIMVFFILGCAKTPDSVQSEINAYEAISVDITDENVEYATLQDIISNTNKTPESVRQFIIKDVTVQLPEMGCQVFSFNLNYASCFDKDDLYNIAQEQFPEIDMQNEENLIFGNFGNNAYLDGEKMIRINGLSGGLSLNHGKTRNAYEENPDDYLSIWSPSKCFEAEKIISLHSGEEIDETLSYMLPEGNVKVSDAMQTAYEYLNKIFSKYENNQFTYRIRKVYIRKLPDGSYGYEFSAERLYNGIVIDSTPMYAFEDATIGIDGYFIEPGDAIYIWMISKDSIDYFYCSGRKTVENSTKNDNRLLTLDSALNILSDKLTSATTFKITSIELIYINGYYRDSYLTRYDDDDSLVYAQYPRETRLVWSITVKDERVKPGTLEFNHDPHHSFFIDAVTGEVIAFYDGTYYY